MLDHRSTTVRLADRLVWEGTFDGRFEDRAYAMEVFERHNEAVSRRDEALARRDEKLAARGAPGTRGRGNATKPVKVRTAPGSSRSTRAPAKKAHPDKAATQPANLGSGAGVVRPESSTRTKGFHVCHAVC